MVGDIFEYGDNNINNSIVNTIIWNINSINENFQYK